MAKGGNNQKSNGSRFTKSHNSSDSFVTKVASRVSDYLGGWFGSPLKSSNDAATRETTPPRLSGDTTEKLVFENVESARSRSTALSHRVFDDMETLNLPAKRFKVFNKDRVDIDFPVSPIPSTSGLFQSPANHAFDVPKSQNFEASVPGPSDPRSGKFGRASEVVPQGPSTTDMKANGATDNHSDSSESTSGCSSLVPQSDRLSQSAYVCSTRKRNLEEKLKYARQLQQSRASSYLNRSIPITDVSGNRKKPSFVVTAYGRPTLEKSLLREKLINSPFYTGQTSYGGASAHKIPRSAFYSQRNPRTLTERGEGMQMQVKPSHHGSTEDLSNMSHTAKKILEALEQFSTPVNDAKRIPLSRSNVPLGIKRRRFDELPETRPRLSAPTSSVNPNPGPVITGLNVPTVPDLLKLKRLERIQNSTAAARQVAVQRQEYSLPTESPPEKRIGKIVTKLRNKEKSVPLEKLEEVNLPKIPLPISTLPKFDFQLPPVTQSAEGKADKQAKSKPKNFVFSPPIAVCVNKSPEQPVLKNNFTFSSPLDPGEKKGVPDKTIPSSLMNFMSSDAVAKLKRKSIGDSSHKSAVPLVPTEPKPGSVMDFLIKSTDEKVTTLKLASGTWECNTCLIRNINDTKLCRGCKAKKLTEEKPRTLPNPPNSNSPAESKPAPNFGFGDKFRPPIGSWSCKECFVNNSASATKCIACESSKPSEAPSEEVPKQDPPKSPQDGFGDMFKKKANQWECSVCMIRNKDADIKCVACETPKPGSKPVILESNLSFGLPPLGKEFKFGIDKTDAGETGVKSAADSSTFQVQANGPQSESSSTPQQFSAISTSVGLFTFGIPPAQNIKSEKSENKIETTKPPTETSNTFLVTSTSGSNLQKDEPQPEKSESEKTLQANADKESALTKSELPTQFIFGALNKSPVKPFFGLPPEEKAPEESKKPNFFFSANSNSNTLETVSSSTTDFTFGQSKTSTGQLSIGEIGANKTPEAFQFKPFVPQETENTKIKLSPFGEEKKNESVSLISGSVTTSSTQSFPPPIPIFNTSKTAFDTPTTSAGSGFVPTTNTSLFGASPPSFSTSSFNSQTSGAPSTSSFGIMSQSTEKPTFSTGITFGTNSVSLSSTPNPFGSAVPSIQNTDPPKTFGSFAANSPIPGFGTNSTPSSAFGSGFMQSSTGPEKSSAPSSFIFGPSAPITTSAPVTTIAAPGVFTFGAANSETKPSFTFGQSSAPNFSFGSNAPTTNVFAGFGQSKPENSLGAATTTSPFGISAPNIFGQSSTPTAFEPSAPKFEFRNSTSQQQDTAPSVFRFSATPAQLAPAPVGTSFRLPVPQNFNFTRGQTAVFSASPSAETTSMRGRSREVRKAVRRTNRDPARRP